MFLSLATDEEGSNVVAHKAESDINTRLIVLNSGGRLTARSKLAVLAAPWLAVHPRRALQEALTCALEAGRKLGPIGCQQQALGPL